MGGSSVAIDLCIFMQNRAEAGGGAIAIIAADAVWVEDTSPVAMNITRTRFVSNRASHGGGVLIMWSGRTSPRIAHSSFDNCSAAAVGGGVDVRGSGSFVLFDTAFTACAASGVGAAVSYDPSAVSSEPLFSATRCLLCGSVECTFTSKHAFEFRSGLRLGPCVRR